jgi:hypothetical protein
MNEVAKEYKGKAIFVYVDGEEPSHSNVMEYFGFNKESLPIYLMFQVKIFSKKNQKS